MAASLLKLPQTWGTLVSKGLTDPVWFFVTDWFPIFLVAKGIALKSGLVAVWIPFLAADLGNFFGGWISGVLIKRGWSVGAARKVDGGIWRIRRDAADSDDFYDETLVDHVAVCDRDVCVRFVFDDCECVADGFV